jgi:gliding motility-associated protein GldL
MSQSQSGKKLMNMVYGLGAAVVIIGALFKIMHWPYGNLMLIIGLVTEAGVFAVSAFEKVDDDLDWSLVYPELAGGAASGGKKESPEGLLSKKLDQMLKDARIDGELITSLSTSISSFEAAAKGMAPTADGMNATKKYSEEMAMAAAQMESLNSLYKVQVESTSRQTEVNERVAENAEQLKAQMEHLTTSLSSLNGVYGGMLSAMSRN